MSVNAGARRAGYLVGYLALVAWAPRAPAQACADPAGEIVSRSGTVEVLQPPRTVWESAEVGARLCHGDSVRTEAYSGAAILLAEGTVFRLAAESAITLQPPADQHRTWLEVFQGIIHVLTRDPRALRVITPFANAGIEGTEFQVVVADEETEVVVFEGEVLFGNETGEVYIRPGQRAAATSTVVAEPETVSQPRAALEWLTYFEPLFASGLPSANAEDRPGDAAFFARRAAARLGAGQVPEAEADIQAALAIDAEQAEALAVSSLLAGARADHQLSLALAERAIRADPVSAPALVAKSYAEQAQLDPEAAIATMERAAAEHPENAVVLVRLAELLFSFSRFRSSLRTAESAIAIDPSLPMGQTILGFAALREGSLDQSLSAFEAAVQRDSTAPLPRLGLGLALIRGGDLARGRAEIESAVALDPNDAVIRSYMGKAYLQENREALAGTQFEIAKALDPTDSTPYYYDALYEQTSNNPVAALLDLNQAAASNGGRLAYRSTLRLDEDLSSRNAGLARTYRDLGFEQLALAAGRDSAIADPSDFSAHRLLADIYSTLPGYQLARASELFQSQMMQPANATPVYSHLGEASLFLLDVVGPSEGSFHEFNSLFDVDGLALYASGIGASEGTFGRDVALSGRHDRLSYGFGQSHYDTDGFRANNDFEKDVANAFVQYRVSSRLSVQAEWRSSDLEQGDLALLFDPANFIPDLRQSIAADSLRVGANFLTDQGGRLTTSLIAQEADTRAIVGPLADLQEQLDTWQLQFQYDRDFGQWRSTVGFSQHQRNTDERTAVSLPFPPFSQTTNQALDDDHTSAYAYANVDLGTRLTATFGATFDAIDDDRGDSIDELSPKLGLSWRVGEATTVRLAAFRTVTGPLIAKQLVLPSLEPTFVGGFNQSYFGALGDRAYRRAVAVDHTIRSNLFIGGELMDSQLDIPFEFPAVPSPIGSTADVDENLARGYLYWAPDARVAFSAELQREKVDNHGTLLFYGFTELRTSRLPLGIRFFSGARLGSRLTTTRVSQKGTFGLPGGPLMQDRDDFWVVDASLTYRLPNRRGLLEFGVRNLFDEEFRFQDTDPETPEIFPSRFGLIRFSVSY
jgi:Tfp pilus assembly protein PilF